MNRCATCKYFTHAPVMIWMNMIEEVPNLGALQHKCGRIAGLEGCDPTSPGHPQDATEPAYVEDASGYYAAIRVREDFGCVLWEAP